MPCPYLRLSKNPPFPLLKKDRKGTVETVPYKEGRFSKDFICSMRL